MKTEKNKVQIKIAILSISSVLMASLMGSAIIADVSNSYPMIDTTLVQMIVTLPPLIAMIFSILSGPLSNKIAKKKIALFGLFSAFFGGGLAYFFGETTIYIMLVSSSLIGVGQGINSTISMALIADYFTDDEGSSLMGLQSAFINGGGMLILFISSLLAQFGWKSSYLVFLLFIPIILIVMKYLPNDPPIQQAQENKPKEKMNGTVYFIGVITFLFAVFMFSFTTNVSVYVTDNELGGAATSGFANTLMSASGAIAGIAYPSIKKQLNNKLIPLGALLAGVGLLLANILESIVGVYLAGIFIGFGLSLFMPTAIFAASVAVKADVSANAIAFVNGASNVGMFLSPFIVDPIINSFNGNVGTKFMISGIILIVLSIFTLVSQLKFSMTSHGN